jgi:hypothetical protein
MSIIGALKYQLIKWIYFFIEINFIKLITHLKINEDQKYLN